MLEQKHQPKLVRPEPGKASRRLGHLLLPHPAQGSVEECLDDLWVDVRLLGDGPGVSKPAPHGLDGLIDRTGCLPLGAGRLLPGELPGGEHGPGPGAEVLGGELIAANLTQVLVHVAGVHGAPPPVFKALEQLVPGKIPATFDDAREALVLDRQCVEFTTLPPELEPEAPSPDHDVAVPKCGQTVRLVVASELG